MFKKIIITTLIIMSIVNISLASGLHDIQDKIQTDKALHFASGYIISDQLQRNAGFSSFEAILTTIAIAYIKEKCVDDTFSKADIGATVGGALMYQIKF